MILEILFRSSPEKHEFLEVLKTPEVTEKHIYNLIFILLNNCYAIIQSVAKGKQHSGDQHGAPIS
jgi:hypothetical protein